MSERTQIQYQPITGPVWRAPVAESLAWLPRAQQPARALEYRRLGDFQQPPFEALYKPQELGWQPRGIAPQVPVEHRILGDFQQPPFASLYQPAGLQWQASDRYSGKPLPRALLDWSVYPLQVQAAAYDPSTLGWMVSGDWPQIAIERRILGDFQQPAFDALYKAEGIQWQPQGKATPTPVERRFLGDFQQPNFNALFKPELLSWEPSDRYAGRAIPFAFQARFLLDPFPPTAAPYDPSFLMWLPRGASYPQVPIERRMVGDFQQPPFDTSSPIPPPTPTFVEIPAGRRKHVRNIYRITVDGQKFEFKSLADALAFLDKTKALAADLARAVQRSATERQAKSAKKVELPTLPLPDIKISSRDLRGAVTETKREIAQIYESALRDAEIGLLIMELERKKTEEESVFWLLM